MSKFQTKLNQTTKLGLLLGLLSLVYFGLTLTDVQGASGINQQLNYQGKLTDSSGVQVSDQNWNFRFRLYNQATNGTLLWTEVHNTTTAQVATVNGIFSVALGEITGFATSSVDFNDDNIWLQIELDAENSGAGDGGWEELFTTRKRLTATPYAFNADTIDGIHATSTAAVANYLLALTSNGDLNLFDGSVSSTKATTTSLYVRSDAFINTLNASTTARFEDVFIYGSATTTGILEITQYASTTNLVLGGDGSNLSNLNDLYVSGGNLFFNATQLGAGGGGGGGAWEKFTGLASPAEIITPTTTNASIYISGNATTTGNLNVDGYASTTNLVLGNDGSNLGTYNDLYVSSGDLFYNATQLTGTNGLSFWQYTFDGNITPTSTTAGLYVTASSTIAANFRVDGTATTTGNFTVIGNTALGTAQPRSTTTLTIQDTYTFSDNVSSTTAGIFVHSPATASGIGLGLNSIYYGLFIEEPLNVATTTYGIYVKDDLYVDGNATTTGNLEISGYASTTNLVLADGASNLGTYNDIYVSGGNLFYNATQITGAGVLGSNWQFSPLADAITPTTSVGIYITASSTIAANFRVDGSATTTGTIYVGGAATSTFQGNVEIVGNLGGGSPLDITSDITIFGNATTTGWFNIGTTDVVGSAINIGAGDLYVGSNATITTNLFVGGFASTTKLILSDQGSDDTAVDDLYVSGGNLFFNATQLGVGGGGTNDWQFAFDNAITPTSTTVGLYVTASSTIAANFRVDGTLNVTGNATSSGWFNIGTTDVVGSAINIGAGDLFVSGNATITNTLIVTNGPVGIGITTASTTLTIKGDSNNFNIRLEEQSGVESFYIGINSGGTFQIYNDNDFATPAFSILDSTNNTSLNGNDLSGVLNINGENNSDLTLNAEQNLILVIDDDASAGNLDFRVTNSAADDLFYVLETGNVGIGTSTPLFQLQVGSILANTYFSVDSSGNATTSGSLVIGTTSPALDALFGAGDLFVGSSATVTDTLSATTIEVNNDYIIDFTGTALSVDSSGVLNAEVQTSDLHSAVTLSGDPDYITLSGQDIIRAKLDINDDTNATGGVGIDITTNDFTFDATELDALTWDAGSLASIAWTWSLSGATDPTLTFANALVTFSTGISVSDLNITNVGNIALDTISSDGTSIVIGSGNSNTITLSDNTSISVALGVDSGDDFIIDTTGFVYEGDDNQVGIGTASPDALLDVNAGDIFISNGGLAIDNDTTVLDVGTGDLVIWDGLLRVCDADNCGNGQATGDGDVYVEDVLEVDNYMIAMGGINIGGGTTDPVNDLFVGGAGISLDDDTTVPGIGAGNMTIWDGLLMVCDGDSCSNNTATADGDLYVEDDIEVDGLIIVTGEFATHANGVTLGAATSLDPHDLEAPFGNLSAGETTLKIYSAEGSRIVLDGVDFANIIYIESDQGTNDQVVMTQLFAGNYEIIGLLDTMVDDIRLMTIDISSGDVTIGPTIQTGYGLAVLDTNSTGGYAAKFFHDGGGVEDKGIAIQAGHDSCTGDNDMIVFFDGDGTNHGSIECDDGQIQIEQASDARLKENIVDVAPMLDLITQLRVVNYNWIAIPGVEKIGFIAQQFMEVMPDIVDYDEEHDLYMMSQSMLIPRLTKAIQELDAKIEELKVGSASTSTEPIIVVDSPNLDIDTLVVQQAATFYGTLYVQGEAGFAHKVVFEEDIEVKGKIYASADQAGTAIIPANATSTEIVFKGEYETTPKITLSIQGAQAVFYGIKDKSTAGFKVVLTEPFDKDLKFDWIVLAVKGQGEAPKITELITSRDTVGFGVAVELWAKVTDADTPESDLEYTWNLEPDIGFVDGNTGLVYWTVDGGIDQDTEVVINVTVSDGSNTDNASAVVTVVVPVSEEPPVEEPPIEEEPPAEETPEEPTPEPEPTATSTDPIIEPDPSTDGPAEEPPTEIVEEPTIEEEPVAVEEPSEEVALEDPLDGEAGDPTLEVSTL